MSCYQPGPVLPCLGCFVARYELCRYELPALPVIVVVLVVGEAVMYTHGRFFEWE